MYLLPSLFSVVIDPYTTTSIPSSMSFLNIIPESDENLRSERCSLVNMPFRRTEYTSIELNAEDITLLEAEYCMYLILT